MKFLALSVFFISLNASAWGPTGHRVVADVAQRYLNVNALKLVHQILNGESMARVSNWPDVIRSEPQTFAYTYPWHYTEWPDLNHEHVEDGTGGKLITAIKENLAVLSNKDAPKDKKAFALKFVIHLVGDLHQPLHVGNGLDHGSNNCKVLFHGKAVNLHAVWDEEMINFTQLSFTEMSNFISMGRTLAEIETWKKGELLQWARESREAGELAYPGTDRQYCQMNTTDLPKIGYEYSYKYLPVVERRLFQGGLRLAVLLNQHLR